MKKKKLWNLLFPVLAVLTVWAVISNSRNFTPDLLWETLKNSSPVWMCGAVCAMFGFIFFEGTALYVVLRGLGYRPGLRQGFLYSAADIYFSAITPSATGGQPASAYFMRKDGIPLAAVTASLVMNLILHSLALLTVGAAGFVFRPDIFLRFHVPGRILIVFGCGVLCFLGLAFCLLIVKPRLLEKICEFILRLAKRLHLMRREAETREKLYAGMEQYRHCAALFGRHKPMLVKAYCLNLLQRISQISVTLLVYLAAGGRPGLGPDVWFAQSYTALGTYSVPIPGGMGVADYLLIDGLQPLFNEAEAVNLELISRGLSFYVCMLISALTVLAGVLWHKRRSADRSDEATGNSER